MVSLFYTQVMEREVSMPEFLLGGELLTDLAPAMITGITGAGKSYLADQLKGSKANLDTLSSANGGKWLTKVDRIKKVDIVFGWSDNMGEVAKAMLEEWEDNTPLTLVWVRPSFELWREVMTLKAAEKGASHDPAHVKSREEMLHWSPSKFKEYENAKFDLIKSKVMPTDVIVVNNSSAKEPIQKGWHEFKPDMGTENLPEVPVKKGVANEG